MTMPAVRTTPPTAMSFVAIVFAVTRHVTNNAVHVMNRQLMAVRSYYGAPPSMEGRHAGEAERGRAPVGRRRFGDDARHRQGPLRDASPPWRQIAFKIAWQTPMEVRLFISRARASARWPSAKPAA